MSRAVAPTAAVEASGSVWEQVRAEIEKAFAEGITPQEIIALFRPQPSGETREVSGHDAHTFLIEFANAITGATLEQRIDHLQAFSARLNALLSARPLALGGQQGETKRVRHKKRGTEYTIIGVGRAQGEISDEDPVVLYRGDTDGGLWVRHQAEFSDGRFEYVTTPARAEAQDEGALSVLDRLLNYSGARGSFDAMKHGDAVKDAEELLRSVKSPSHTDLMVTPESIDAYMKDNPMEAKDEGAAGEIKSCPFCGGEAEIIHLDDDDNAGGSCVCCTKCQASGNVEFGRKENFVENWNRRSHPSPPPAADADRVRIAVEALEKADAAARSGAAMSAADYSISAERLGEEIYKITTPALAALKSTAAKEGGAPQGDAAPEAG